MNSNMGMGVFWIGIGLVAMAALFALVTLPVEYNASHRAIQWLERSRSLDDAQVMQARIPLRWAARTYLVAALNAIGVLAYYLIIALSGRRN